MKTTRWAAVAALALSGCYSVSGFYDKSALEDSKAALKALPNTAWAHSTAGMVLHLGGNHEDAVKSLTRALQIQPDAETYGWRGRAFLALRRFKSATDDLDRAVAADPAMAKELEKELAEVKNRRGD